MSHREKKNNAFLLILLPQRKKKVTHDRPLLVVKVLFRDLKHSDLRLGVEVNFPSRTREENMLLVFVEAPSGENGLRSDATLGYRSVGSCTRRSDRSDTRQEWCDV